MSATKLAEKIRQKELSSVEVVQAFISRIKEVNSILNAVVDNRCVVLPKLGTVMTHRLGPKILDGYTTFLDFLLTESLSSQTVGTLLCLN